MRADEVSLWKRCVCGDDAAKNELVLIYLALAEVIAKRIARSAGWANWEDLRQDGVIGLIKAVRRFDPHRGVEFRVFAKRYIRGEIFDSSELTRDLARRQQEIHRKVRLAEQVLTSTLQRNPTIEEVAEEAELTIEQIRNAIDAMDVAFAGELPANYQSPAFEGFEDANQEMKILIEDALSRLSEREQSIVIYYYWEGASHDEIARRLRLTASNVAKIRQRAIVKLSKQLGVSRKGPEACVQTTWKMNCAASSWLT